MNGQIIPPRLKLVFAAGTSFVVIFKASIRPVSGYIWSTTPETVTKLFDVYNALF